jgi:hypothetical protein
MNKKTNYTRLLGLSVILVVTVLAWITSSTIGEDDKGTQMTAQVRKPIPPPEQLAKLPSDGGPEYNRLVFSQSPYLLQHAGNPVDWHPWGDEAFEKSRKENKPVFLSVGYSTCHWCHVMEHESFEDAEVAALMNELFIPVKVDREERPDVDKIYMDVTQAMTGHGGWPMTVILTPDRKPFFAGTYFPKTSRFGKPGMLDLLPQLSAAWKDRRTEVEESADKISEHLAQMNRSIAGEGLDEESLHLAFNQLSSRFDDTHGGFGSAPKFPTPQNLTFLTRYGKRTGNPDALKIVETTLVKMRLGGMYDQVGFGFHRYSTDRTWLLPHFEKMLYDQALVAIAYLDAARIIDNPLLKQTAHEVFTYVLRDLTSPEGGFFSAEDADSEGVEGKFYVWSTDEVESILGTEDADLYVRVFNLKPGGNFSHEAGGHGGDNDNIPHLNDPLPVVAKKLGMDPQVLADKLEASRQKLFDVREKRIHPFKDDKILTDWNGLMIAAFAQGSIVLEEPRYADAARRAAEFMIDQLTASNGRLHKRYRAGSAGLPAHIEDYAFASWGMLDLYEATFDVKYLKEAQRLSDILLAHFWDESQGGLFLTADDGEKLLVRAKEVYDGAIPSGNSVAAENFLRLGRMTGDTKYEEKADAVFKAFSPQVSQQPSAFNQLMNALDFAVGPSFEIVVAGTPGDANTADMLAALRKPFLPNAVFLFRSSADDGKALAALAPYTATMTQREDKATAYVCENFVCNQPTTDIQKMLSHLGLESK